MNRPTSLLQRHLLTRSDLAELEVPATEVFRWLADGMIEQVGELPADDGGDPVFTVLSDELRRDLEQRLSSIDKPTVVMTPLGVRSFLLRALLHQRSPLPEQAALETEQLAAEANTTPVDESQARLVTRDEIGDVLQDLAIHRIDDVQTVLQLAAEIAATESVMTSQLPVTVAASSSTPTASADAATQDESMANTPEPEELFDDPARAESGPRPEDHEPHSSNFDDEEDVFVEIEFDDEAPSEERSDDEGRRPEAALDEDIGERLAAAALAADDEPATDVREPPHSAEPDIDDEILGDLIAEVANEEEEVEREQDVVEDSHEAPSESHIMDETAETAGAPAADAAPHDDEPTESASDDPGEDDVAEEATDATETVLDEAPSPDDAQMDATTTDANGQEPVDAQDSGSSEGDYLPVDGQAATIDEVVGEALVDNAAQSAVSSDTTDDVPAEDAEEATSEPMDADVGEFALTSATMDRVQDFLGELKSALVEMAQRPSPPPESSTSTIDVEPLVKAVQAGFDRSAEQATQTTSALASLAQRMGEFGERVEAGVSETVRSIQTPHSASSGPTMAMTAAPAEFVESPARRQRLVLSAVAILVVCWSILFWVKTGSPRLALGTLVGANAVACCLLLARRDR